MSAPQNARIALYVSVVITVILWAGFVPFSGLVAKPLFLLSTFFHELGHAIAALLVGHSVESIGVNWDGSGITWSAGPPNANLAGAIISAGGLIGPAITAAIMFTMGKNAKRSRMALGVFGAGMLLVDVLFVRNLFGFIYVAIFGLLFLGLALKAGTEFTRFVIIFIATQLSLTVFTRADYLFSSNPASDVQQMAQALFLPYWVWGFVCGTLSVVILFFGIRQYAKS